MKVIIASAGSFRFPPCYWKTITEASLIMAADGGADALLGIGIVPHIFVGDLDSLSSEGRRRLEASGCEFFVHPQEKDATDTEITLRLAVEQGAQEIIMLGALGGPRLDHTVANILLLAAPFLENVQVRLVDEAHEIFMVSKEAEIHGHEGDVITLLALTPKVTGITTTGLYYALSEDSLYMGPTRGVSNVLIRPVATIRVKKGKLLVIRYFQDHLAASSSTTERRQK